MNKKHVLFAMGTLFSTVPFVSFAAQSLDRETLARSATGQRFLVGDTAFRLVPDAVAVPSRSLDTTNKALRSTASGASAGQASADKPTDVRIGDYTIVAASPSDGSTVQATSADAGVSSPPGDRYAVALSESSGSPVLVSPTVNVFASAAVVETLARQTGGRVVYASDVAVRGAIRYDTVEQAIAALPALTASNKVEQASLDVVQAFNRPL